MAFPCLSMVLDPLGKVLISNNIETFVCDGSDNDVAGFEYITNCLCCVPTVVRKLQVFKLQIWYLQYSPKIMHAQELLFASARRFLRLIAGRFSSSPGNRKNFFAVAL